MKSFKTVLLAIALVTGFNSLYAQKSGFPPNQIGKMFSLYLDIKNALIKNDGTTAKIKANELHAILIAQPDKGLMTRQIDVLADNLPGLIGNSREIGYTVDENTQRHYFADLTISMYNLVKGLRVNKSQIYKQYCPINKAYWLSETPVIKNPYYNYDGWSKIGQTTEILPKTILTD
ncbi:MAG TPA: DUF3347 domain-containing protein [Mucilaginibacter sp.]|jgi:hypothetical protein|nr:DUF3347 domain-containing protein [Mucilaginibacter sp.]